MIDTTLGQGKIAIWFLCLGLCLGMAFFVENLLRKKFKKFRAYTIFWDILISASGAIIYLWLCNKLCFMKFMLLQPVCVLLGAAATYLAIFCIVDLTLIFHKSLIKRKLTSHKK